MDTKFPVSRVVPKKDRRVDSYEYDYEPPHVVSRVTKCFGCNAVLYGEHAMEGSEAVALLGG